MATCGNDYKIKIWHIPADLVSDKTKPGKSKVPFKLRIECVKFERSLVQSVAFAIRDASVVAASCIDGTIRFFDTKSGLSMLIVNCPGVTCIAVSNNYEYLAIASNLGRCSVYTLHHDENQSPGPAKIDLQHA